MVAPLRLPADHTFFPRHHAVVVEKWSVCRSTNCSNIVNRGSEFIKQWSNKSCIFANKQSLKDLYLGVCYLQCMQVSLQLSQSTGSVEKWLMAFIYIYIYIYIHKQNIFNSKSAMRGDCFILFISTYRSKVRTKLHCQTKLGSDNILIYQHVQQITTQIGFTYSISSRKDNFHTYQLLVCLNLPQQKNCGVIAPIL